MASTPNIQQAELPAAKPERQVDVSPEDIVLGSGQDSSETSEGKRQLKRPRTAAGSGLQI